MIFKNAIKLEFSPSPDIFRFAALSWQSNLARSSTDSIHYYSALLLLPPPPPPSPTTLLEKVLLGATHELLKLLSSTQGELLPGWVITRSGAAQNTQYPRRL